MTALDELREALRAAAHRDVAAVRVRARRRRATGLLAAVLLGGAAVATATDLISEGPPVRDPTPQGPAYRPSSQRQIVVKADGGAALPFGVAVYHAHNGRRCALAGVVRGAQLGALERGRFRPYPADRAGACNVPGRHVFDIATVAGRRVIYGLAGRGVRTIHVRELGREYPVGPGGAVLVLYDRPGVFHVDERE